MPVCAVDSCDRDATGRGWCPMHYQRWAKHGDPTVLIVRPEYGPICAVAGCGHPRQKREWCGGHYARWLHGAELESQLRPQRPERGACIVEGCERLSTAHGWCMRHYHMYRQTPP